MKQLIQHFADEKEDRNVVHIVSRLIFISWSVYLVVIITALLDHDLKLIAAALAGCALQILPFVLVRRGHLRAGSMTVVLTAVLTVTVITTVGQGIRDLGLIAFPIIFIFAGLTLPPGLFRYCVGSAIAAVCWLALGEAMGWFIPQPFEGANSDLITFMMVTLLLLVAAVAVNLLVANMRRNLEQAQQEIAQRKRTEDALQESEERFKLSMDATNDGLWDWNIATDLGYFSPGYYRMLGYTVGDFPMAAGSWNDLIHPDDRETALRVNTDCIEGRCEQFEVEYRMQARDGEWRWILGRGKCVARDAQGRALRLLGTHMDITARKQSEEQLRYQGTHDALTGIFNRAFFEEELVRFERSREFPVSIVIADVDGLKTINDTVGHAAGDGVLRQAAQILCSVFRAGDVLARIGGDEFAALLPATGAADANHIAGRIRDRLAEHNRTFPDAPVQFSLGCATAEQGDLSATFRLADQRMYQEKAARKRNLDPSTAA